MIQSTAGRNLLGKDSAGELVYVGVRLLEYSTNLALLFLCYMLILCLWPQRNTASREGTPWCVYRAGALPAKPGA